LDIHDARVQSKDDYLMRSVAGRGCDAGVNELLDHGWKATGTALTYSVTRLPMATIERLIKMGADVNYRVADSPAPIHWCFSKPEVEALLVRHGADINLACKFRLLRSLKKPTHYPDESEQGGVTPIMIAAQHGSLDDVKQLVKLGADPRRKSRQGRTASYYAQIAGNIDTAEYLRRLETGRS